MKTARAYSWMSSSSTAILALYNYYNNLITCYGLMELLVYTANLVFLEYKSQYLFCGLAHSDSQPL